MKALAGPILALAALLLGPAGLAAQERTLLKAAVGGETIDVHFYRPAGSGPFPLLVMSHGSPREPEQRAQVGERTFRAQALAYARQGVAVAVPIRRGYGGSGRWAEGYGGCEVGDFHRAGSATAEDIHAAVAASVAQPGIDRRRVVLLGQSAGAWGSIAAAGRDGLLGVVAFAGGRGSTRPGVVCREERLIEAAGRFGAASRVPQLWIYSLNDSYFGAELPRRLHAAFTAAGGRARLEQVPPYGSDGHGYVRAVDAWKPGVDRFLRSIGFF